MMNFTDPISLKQAAKIAKETPANFLHFVKRKETPPHIKIGRFYVFSRQAMLDWVKPHKQRGGARPKRKKREKR